MSNLEVLIRAYVGLVTLWSKTSAGENAGRIWGASIFLEKLIKKELEK